MAEHTRNAGIECLLRAFIAPEQRSGEAPRNKDELRYLIAGVFSWFYEGAVPKKGREAHIITKVLEHVAAELNTAQPPAPPTPPRRRGASAATPATDSTADAAEQGGKAKAKPPLRCQWGMGDHKSKRSGSTPLLDTETHAAALALALNCSAWSWLCQTSRGFLNVLASKHSPRLRQTYQHSSAPTLYTIYLLASKQPAAAQHGRSSSEGEAPPTPLWRPRAPPASSAPPPRLQPTVPPSP